MADAVPLTPEQESLRAEKARSILNDDAFSSAVNAVEGAILAGIKNSAIKDAELREKLCQQYISLHAILGQLEAHIETGELAKATLAQRLKAVVNW